MFEDKKKNEDGVWEISPAALLSKMLKPKSELRIIDVRRDDEYSGELGHIEGAELVTLETKLTEEVEKWDKNQSIVFVCRSGGRSSRATLYAQSHGFQNVYNMQGGMMLWNELGLPKV